MTLPLERIYLPSFILHFVEKREWPAGFGYTQFIVDNPPKHHSSFIENGIEKQSFGTISELGVPLDPCEPQVSVIVTGKAGVGFESGVIA